MVLEVGCMSIILYSQPDSHWLTMMSCNQPETNWSIENDQPDWLTKPKQTTSISGTCHT